MYTFKINTSKIGIFKEFISLLLPFILYILYSILFFAFDYCNFV